MAFDAYCCKESSFPEVVLTESKTEQLKLLHAYFDTMILKDLAEHYKVSNIAMLRYFIKRIMANLTKPTSINAIYKDIRSQGLKVNRDDLYLWANYMCSIFMFLKISKYDRSLVKEQKSLDKYYCIDNGLRSAVLLPQSDDQAKSWKMPLRSNSIADANLGTKFTITKAIRNATLWCNARVP